MSLDQDFYNTTQVVCDGKVTIQFDMTKPDPDEDGSWDLKLRVINNSQLIVQELTVQADGIELLVPDEAVDDDFVDTLEHLPSIYGTPKHELLATTITESLHQSLDGWSEGEQITIMRYLNDIGLAMKNTEE